MHSGIIYGNMLWVSLTGLLKGTRSLANLGNSLDNNFVRSAYKM